MTDLMAASGQQVCLHENFEEGPMLSSTCKPHRCSEAETWEAAREKRLHRLSTLVKRVDPCPLPDSSKTAWEEVVGQRIETTTKLVEPALAP